MLLANLIVLYLFNLFINKERINVIFSDYSIDRKELKESKYRT